MDKQLRDLIRLLENRLQNQEDIIRRALKVGGISRMPTGLKTKYGSVINFILFYFKLQNQDGGKRRRRRGKQIVVNEDGEEVEVSVDEDDDD